MHVVVVATLPSFAVTIELAIKVVAALFAIGALQRETHCLARVVPLIVFTTAAILDTDMRSVLLGIMHTEQPTLFPFSADCHGRINILRSNGGVITLILTLGLIEKDHILESNRRLLLQ
jgi:hypothetical protein